VYIPFINSYSNLLLEHCFSIITNYNRSQNAGTLTAAIGGASVPFVAPGFNPTPAQIGRTGPVSRLLPGEGAAPTKEELVKLAGIDCKSHNTKSI